MNDLTTDDHGSIYTETVNFDPSATTSRFRAACSASILPVAR